MSKAVGFFSLIVGLAATGCSHAAKKKPVLSELEGKKVALIEIEGEATARAVVEVALINQLVQRGSFEIIPKQEINQARTATEQDPTDWVGIARRAGADYALKAKVLQFSAEQKDGYSSEELYDSQLAAERGEKEGKTQRLFKVKSLSAKVQVQLDFEHTDPKNPDRRSGVAEAERTVTAESKTEAAHLPPRLRFLEELSNEAFNKFFKAQD
ncbi:hypothetical protein WDW37_07185 [Bdellovibrionota bacterium FG-1]